MAYLFVKQADPALATLTLDIGGKAGPFAVFVQSTLDLSTMDMCYLGQPFYVINLL
jgi:outer membrane lipopolysaccharide assembly protein LptE/RlpB